MTNAVAASGPGIWPEAMAVTGRIGRQRSLLDAGCGREGDIRRVRVGFASTTDATGTTMAGTLTVLFESDGLMVTTPVVFRR